MSSSAELNNYIQGLSTVSNRDKKKLETYLNNICWLPNGVPFGYIDGILVQRPLADPYNEFIQSVARMKR